MQTDRGVVLHQRLERRLERIGGRQRLDLELARLAAELLGPYEQELSPAEREWLERALAGATDVAIEPALAAFLDQLTTSLTAAPEELIAHVTRAQQRAEMGGE